MLHGKGFWVFFFSSRRRHTRSLRDWSSDVCSSDLARFARGEKDAGPLERAAVEALERHGARVDYAELRDRVTLERRNPVDESMRLFLAAFLGKTRLIDNGALGESG